MAKTEKDKKKQVAYVPFKTFLSAIEHLEQGVPPLIDRTVWPNYSGAIQSQLLGAFRFFGLIGDAGEPTETLNKLVNEQASRKDVLRHLLEKHYPGLMKLNLAKASPGSFNSAIQQYDISGATLGKASSFFLQAARYAGLPLSPYIRKQSRRASTKRRKRNPRVRLHTGDTEPIEKVSENQLGSTKSIELQNGVTLSLSTSADTFKMAAEDRRFVVELLEKLEQYETKGTSARPEKQRRGRRKSGGEL